MNTKASLRKWPWIQPNQYRVARAGMVPYLAAWLLSTLVTVQLANAQGTVSFSNTTIPPERTHVFAPCPTNPALSLIGNGTSDIPPGTVDWSGFTRIGAGGVAGQYGAAGTFAQLLSANGANQPESLLTPQSPTTTFRTGGAAGYVAAVTATLNNVPRDAPLATIQMVAWDNSSGIYPTWAEAFPAWVGGLIAAGKGIVVNVTNIGGHVNPSPYILGLQSFNLFFVPFAPPTILHQPTNQATLIGLGADFTVAAAGSAPLFYQWYFNSTNTVSSASTNCCLELANVQPGQAGAYTVVITNDYGAVTSAPALLTVREASPPTIVTPPSSQTVLIGATVDFSVVATGWLPLTYSWLFNATNALGTGTNLHLANVQFAQAGAYSVIVSNFFGVVTSAPAWLTVTGIPPVIVGSPTNLAVAVGARADFRVGATGLPLPVYQWAFGGTGAITGATNSVLSLANVQFAQAGAYTVIVSNVFGVVTSAPAWLTVTGVPPVIVSSPTNQKVWIAGTATFSVVAEGTLPLAYQWLRGADAILQATNSALQLTNVEPWQAGVYTVVVTNAYGAVTSAPAALEVFPPGTVVIVSSPTNQKVWIAGTATFSVVAEGTLPLGYQWLRGADAILQATNSTLQLTNVQYRQAGVYTVVVTNAYGAATSAPAALEVFPAGTVLTASEADLRAAMAGGGVVTFACDGTIFLAYSISIVSDTRLDGSGRQVTVSGNRQAGVFIVNTNVTFTVVRLTIAEGSVVWGRGAAIFNNGGTVDASYCSFWDNTTFAPAPYDDSQYAVYGGAIYNGAGQVNLRSCAFGGNRASGGSGFGGAIYNSGTMTLDSCTFTDNSASGGDGAGWPDFYASAGRPGGEGSGGAIFNEGTLTVDRTTLCGNTATGGTGGAGPNGVPPPPSGGSPDGFPGGNGGSANGAAICNLGTLRVTRSTFAANVGTGGDGGAGGIATPPLTYGGAHGGAGGNAGSGLGGLFNSGAASLVNCTIAFNTGRGRAGGAGGAAPYGFYHGGTGGAGGNGGSGVGGVGGTCNLTNCTIISNLGQAGSGGAGGVGGPGWTQPGS